MKTIKMFSLAAIALGLSLTACKNEKAADAAATTTDAMAATTATDASATPSGDASAVPAAPTGPTTTAEFAEMVHDWGELKEGEKMIHEFKFKNTGSEPLVISDAKGSCGCTVPDWPREPIAPGKEGVIKVEFDSKGKGSDDGSKQTKRVTVTANTNPPQTYLTITGVVHKVAGATPAK